MGKDYIVIIVSDVEEEKKDIVIALLAHIGFEGFDESSNALKAYISKDTYNEASVKEITDLYSLSYKVEDEPSQNWNAVWESNFEPVVIDDFVAVRAHFHAAIPSVEHEIIITPKMSFGTGHHATTTMMMLQMRSIDFTNKAVLDFGAGTGILSILAEQLGATDILAIDNDEWSIENSKENVERNNCKYIELELRNDANVNRSFDVILANINRNVIIENLAFLSSKLNEGGCLLLSGLLAEDEEKIQTEASLYGLSYFNTIHRMQWISVLYGR